MTHFVENISAVFVGYNSFDIWPGITTNKKLGNVQARLHIIAVYVI